MLKHKIIGFIATILFHIFFRLGYRIRIVGLENLPEEGPYVLASNHVSYLDGMLMYFMIPFKKKKPRIVYWAVFGRVPVLHSMSIAYRGIPVEAGKQAVRAIREASKALDEGDSVGIFPEGGITRHGVLMPFKPGIEHMLRGRDHVPVVPMYIGGLWGSIYGFRHQKALKKWPERLTLGNLLRLRFRREVTIYIGEPIHNFRQKDVRTLPNAVAELQHRFFQTRWEKVGPRSDNFSKKYIPVRKMIRNWKKKVAKQTVIADTTMELTGRKALIASLIFRRRLRRILGKNEKNVGILIPPCVPSVLTNAALGLDRRTAVNLNYTMSNEIMNYCIRKVGMRHVITSKKVMADKMFSRFAPECDLVYLEDIKESVTLMDKISAALMACVFPLWLTERLLGLQKIKPSDPMTIVFTSGSTGIPKGVVLTHQNVGGNIYAFMDILAFTQEDSAIGVLPFFHSFGYSCLLWSVLSYGFRGYYHVSPLDCTNIAKLCRKYSPTIMVGTPTFLRMYTRRIDPEDFASLKVVVSGAERCPAALMDEFEKRFGVRPVQGYGVTEAAPVVCVNIPKDRRISSWAPFPKDESIGLQLYGMSVQIRNPETGEPCKCNEVGMLWISGINVMSGYYEEPEKTAEVLKDGWYCTGDLAYLDQDNFIFIAGRMSRFAKIGGEMVPHEGLEDALNKILGNSVEDEPKICVTSVPDEKKGEKIVVLYTELQMAPAELNAKLLENSYPPIWLPGVDAYYPIESIPVLGTGKLDLYAIKKLAEEKAGTAQSDS